MPKKTKRGRKEPEFTEVVSFRLTPGEYELLVSKAIQAGIPLGLYVRQRIRSLSGMRDVAGPVRRR